MSLLGADEAVKLFMRLLWSGARRRGIGIDSITITASVNVADGGIDAEIRPNAIKEAEDILVAGNSFFQIKAGTSVAPWQKGWIHKELLNTRGRRSKATLGEAVRNCLEKRGRYVLVCFGCDPTSIQRRKAIQSIQHVFKSCGFPNARVDVWGQSTLVGLLQVFPSLMLRLSNRDNLPFLTHTEWQLDATMSVPLHTGKAQQKLIEDIRTCLRGNDARHVRVIGEPGLGKTRMVLEATSTPDLASTVVYVRNPEDFERSPLFNTVVRSDDHSCVTLVIDDCPEKNRASIWNVLRQRSDRIRLVTLDHGPESSQDHWMRILKCPELEPDQIKAILTGYVGANTDPERWVSFCSGSPRVAHAVGDNLRSNPQDILKPPASVPIWERFVHGNTRSGSIEEGQLETVLRHLALFHKFGFEKPVDAEASFIAGLVHQVDPAITWAKFQSIVKQMRDRRILQGNTTLFLVPHALHIHLWVQFWEHYGVGIDLQSLLTQMPESLFRWFTEMFKYGHASARSMSKVEELTGSGGPFDKTGFIEQEKGAEFLNELAEAHPEATLRCIERTIGNWPHDQLVEFKHGRQYVVWALEKIAIWRDLFQRAAAELLKLAAAENGSNGNNATGTFCGLFEMGFDRMASSEAPPAMRIITLERAINSVLPDVRKVGIKALACALADHPHTKHIGPEHQGLRPLPDLWKPKTWGEVYDAYAASWRLGRNSWRDRRGAERSEIAKVLADAAFYLLRLPVLEKDIIGAFEEMVGDAETDLRPLVFIVVRYRRLRWKSLARKTAAALRRIEESLAGQDLPSKIVRLVLLGTWDDMDRGGKNEYGVAHTKKLRQLARQAIAARVQLDPLLPRLVAEPGFALLGFGHALGKEDVAFQLWPELVRAFVSAGDGRKPELLSGYLTAAFTRERQWWESSILDLLYDAVLKGYAQQLVVASGMTDGVLATLLDKLERSEIPETSMDAFVYARRPYAISLERCFEFIAWCVKMGRPALIRSALVTTYTLFCQNETVAAMPEQPILNLLTASAVFQDRSGSYHEWAEVVNRYIEGYPNQAMYLLESVLERFTDHHFVLNLTYSQAQTSVKNLVDQDPSASWTIVSRLMEPLRGDRTWHIAHWLGARHGFNGAATSGPISWFNVADILDWVDTNPSEHAHFIARECPKTFIASEGGELTRKILIRYGDQDGVREALDANFGTDGWSGKASEHHRMKRDKMRNWLAAESEPAIIDWLQSEINDLNSNIKYYEIREEREF